MILIKRAFYILQLACLWFTWVVWLAVQTVGELVLAIGGLFALPTIYTFGVSNKRAQYPLLCFALPGLAVTLVAFCLVEVTCWLEDRLIGAFDRQQTILEKHSRATNAWPRHPYFTPPLFN